MKSDLDLILADNNLDAILVVGPAMHNPAMFYLTGGGHVTNADLIKKRGEKGVLFHGPMERDEALKSGLDLRSYSSYPMNDLLKQSGFDRTRAVILRYQRMFTDLGLTTGRVGLFGRMDAGAALELFAGLQSVMPGLTFVGDVENKILQKGMATKDESEVARIRHAGLMTTEVVGLTAEYLTSQKAKDGVLVKKNGQPVTIGEVKQKINLWLAERGMENPEGAIFAIGRDAGVPHSSGNPGDVLRLGETIVFDIFPCEAGGGYYYDLTRTWCLGYAPDEVLKLYEQVHMVYDQMTAELRMGVPFSQYQRRACELFEEMGHPTVLNTPETEEGYVHSLGHGVGLNIHERPASGSTASAEDVLTVGNIITIEPGLYYPEHGMGVRLEDTLWARPDGTFEVLANYPMELVLPVKGG
jgi:Xaa-Pro aminopeptidase